MHVKYKISGINGRHTLEICLQRFFGKGNAFNLRVLFKERPGFEKIGRFMNFEQIHPKSEWKETWNMIKGGLK